MVLVIRAPILTIPVCPHKVGGGGGGGGGEPGRNWKAPQLDAAPNPQGLIITGSGNRRG